MDLEKYERFILNNSDYFTAMYSFRKFISIEKLRKYKAILSWNDIGSNSLIQWNEMMFEEFNTYLFEWSDDFFIDNHLTWTVELLSKYKSQLNWGDLIQNVQIIQNIEICNAFKPELFKADVGVYPCDGSDEYKDLILNFTGEKYAEYVLKNSSSYIENHIEELFSKESDIETFDLINWDNLSRNENLPWSLSFIEKYEDKLNWDILSRKECLPWSVDFIKKYANRWNWSNLSKNSAVSWNHELIETYKDKIDWIELSKNNGINFTLDFFHQYKDKLLKSEDCSVEIVFNKNNETEKIVITNEGAICNYEDYYNYEDCSRLVKWDLDTLKQYESKINWNELSLNMNMDWSIDILNEYNDQINLFRIYHNTKLWEDVFSILTDSDFDYFLDKILYQN